MTKHLLFLVTSCVNHSGKNLFRFHKLMMVFVNELLQLCTRNKVNGSDFLMALTLFLHCLKPVVGIKFLLFKIFWIGAARKKQLRTLILFVLYHQ